MQEITKSKGSASGTGTLSKTADKSKTGSFVENFIKNHQCEDYLTCEHSLFCENGTRCCCDRESSR